jgi:hypothetical protein
MKIFGCAIMRMHQRYSYPVSPKFFVVTCFHFFVPFFLLLLVDKTQPDDVYWFVVRDRQIRTF